MSLPIGSGTGTLPSNENLQISEHKCTICGKVLANKKNLEYHITKIHGEVQGTIVQESDSVNASIQSTQDTTGCDSYFFIAKIRLFV